MIEIDGRVALLILAIGLLLAFDFGICIGALVSGDRDAQE